MVEKKASKYFRYAIGEILLVVFGILIALQINNWNEANKDERDIAIIKNNLLNEFQQNRIVLKDRIALLQNALDHANALISLIGKSEELINQRNVDSILVQTLYYGNFNPSNSSITELLQSGKLKLIKDNTLKNQLNDWLEMLKDTNEDFKNQDLTANEQLMPYLHNHISTRNLDLEGNYKVTKDKSTLILDYYFDVLNDFKFENLMTTHMVWHTIMLKHYKELDILAETIMKTLQNDE
jgi:hypothetical protein